MIDYQIKSKIVSNQKIIIIINTRINNSNSQIIVSDNIIVRLAQILSVKCIQAVIINFITILKRKNIYIIIIMRVGIDNNNIRASLKSLTKCFFGCFMSKKFRKLKGNMRLKYTVNMKTF